MTEPIKRRCNKETEMTTKTDKKEPKTLKDGDKDWATPCKNCDQLPTVYPIGLCGPCCFGSVDTIGGNW